ELPDVTWQPSSDPGVAVDPRNLAYVMFTSGSTGMPKGVAVTQADVAGLALDSCWGEAHRRVLVHSPHSFDASTYELWVPLVRRGRARVDRRRRRVARGGPRCTRHLPRADCHRRLRSDGDDDVRDAACDDRGQRSTRDGPDRRPVGIHARLRPRRTAASRAAG